MSDNNRPNQGLLRSHVVGALTPTSTIANRTGEPRPTLGTLLDFVSFGLAAAATIIIFSIASFSFLYTSEGMPRGSGIRDRGVEVEPVLSDGFLYTHANRPVLAERELLGSVAEATVSTSPDSPAAHHMRPPEVSGAQPGSEPLSPSASEGSATQDASLSGTAPMRPPEVSGAQPGSEPLSPSASEGSATQDASLSGTAPMPEELPIPAVQRDRVFPEFEINLGPSHEKMPTRNIQQGQSRDYYFSTNAAFWMYHLRKECGPIQEDPALHADCVRSFRAQYPVPAGRERTRN